MRIFSKSTLRTFWEQYPETESVLKVWHDTVKHADWESPFDVKETYATASITGGRRIVFNIKGNQFRLIVEVNYEYSSVFVLFIGTHKEYDKIIIDDL
ncbi:type II toxin-antitoxin system HigB family toxin [Lewinella sp. 4G2]|uniref:type II toxin-antitoxin system HigB family toxin n=1 Tax=Lewinella sp. 4G2 TaxID=1803372 RepID=UPI0007B4B18F|nr:addiction module toxin RelE [Lewinella sp. 4G2]